MVNDPVGDFIVRLANATAIKKASVSVPFSAFKMAIAEKLRDAIRLQFPVAILAGPERPHFFLGSPGKPVALWHWQADLNEADKNAVVKELAEGFQRPIRAQEESAQDVSGRGAWKDGRTPARAARWRTML